MSDSERCACDGCVLGVSHHCDLCIVIRIEQPSESTWAHGAPVFKGVPGACLLVAAITITCALFWKPSISDSIWFRVWSLSSFPWAPPRVRPTASISSMKMIAGAKLRACTATIPGDLGAVQQASVCSAVVSGETAAADYHPSFVTV